MNIGNRLQELRKKEGLTQEELADRLGVSRQSISKWEQDVAYPETEKLIKLAALYDVTIDSLINPNYVEKPKADECVMVVRAYHYEYKSKKTLFGLPLVHVNVGRGLYVAKGIIAVGNISLGFISLGILSVGLLSLGVLSLGVISIAAFALGLLFAVGSIAVGMIAIGAIAIGLFSIGAVAVGYFSYGALSVAKYVAIGENAHGFIALGNKEASGTYAFLSPFNRQEIEQLMDSKIPSIWKLFIHWMKTLIN